MVLAKILTIVVAVASVLVQVTFGFTPSCLQTERLNTMQVKNNKHRLLRNSLRVRNVLVSRRRSTAESEIDKQDSSTTAHASQDASKESAIEALQRLLARQQSELEETKRVLELYQHAKNLDHDDREKSVQQQSQLISVASSIKEGFDYGFVSRSEGPCLKDLKAEGNPGTFAGYGPPANLLEVGSQQFMRNLKAMRNEYEDEVEVELTPKQAEVRHKLKQLTLNSTAIWERELKDGPIEGPLVIKIPYLFLCYMLDYVFENKYVPSRFFLLETVARMPYFSYITMLHLYESLGFWRRSADVKRIHFAEELNEFHHLMIMESLGGDQRWWVRFMAQHSAIAYYIGLCLLWALSPSLSYKFSELLESHAVNTYSQFLDENEELLKTLPPSLAAVDYYALGSSDPYYAEFQTAAITEKKEIRRPGVDMKNLFDVFSAIRDDEGDHVSTMKSCLDPTVAKLSPSLERRALTAVAAAVAIGVFLGTTSGGSGVVSSDLVDTAVDLTAASDDAAIATGLVEGAMAGAMGALSRSGLDFAEGLGVEEGTFMGLRGVVAELMRIFSRLL